MRTQVRCARRVERENGVPVCILGKTNYVQWRKKPHASGRSAHAWQSMLGSQFWRLGSKSRASCLVFVVVALHCSTLCVAQPTEAPQMNSVETHQHHGRSLKQILAPVRYSLVPFRDALYNLGEAIVDLALVPKQLEWVDAINARVREHEAYGETTNDYGAMDYNYDALADYDVERVE